ncbi:hypothetical protein M2254_002147 [Chryseobacterium sp. BIGb0186]|nr:hypothetical protein [Chryseobacterium sp. JUb44]MDH6210563.1 hypothetical protein [Chryseobacterium sp. BIGb0186]
METTTSLPPVLNITTAGLGGKFLTSIDSAS